MPRNISGFDFNIKFNDKDYEPLFYHLLKLNYLLVDLTQLLWHHVSAEFHRKKEFYLEIYPYYTFKVSIHNIAKIFNIVIKIFKIYCFLIRHNKKALPSISFFFLNIIFNKMVIWTVAIIIKNNLCAFFSIF